MDAKIPDTPILERFRAAVNEIYGNRLDRVVLLGSRARGDAREDSDYDVAIFLKSLPDRWAELDRLARLRVELLDETGAFFDVKPYPASAYRERSALMHEIRRFRDQSVTAEALGFLHKAVEHLERGSIIIAELIGTADG